MVNVLVPRRRPLRHNRCSDTDKPAYMRSRVIGISGARSQLSRLIARVERGERIVIARAGKPVAELRPVRKRKKRAVPPDDPLLRVDEYCYDGPIGPTANRHFDSTICGF